MDPITHTCSGILLGQGLRPLTAVRRTTLLVAGLAAFSPDVDSVSYLWGADAFYRVHHTYTHTLVGLVVVALVLATIESRWLTNLSFSRLLWINLGRRGPSMRRHDRALAAPPPLAIQRP